MDDIKKISDQGWEGSEVEERMAYTAVRSPFSHDWYSLLVRDEDPFRKCSIITCVTVVVMMTWVGKRGVMEPGKCKRGSGGVRRVRSYFGCRASITSVKAVIMSTNQRMFVILSSSRDTYVTMWQICVNRRPFSIDVDSERHWCLSGNPWGIQLA